jgi:hypothetical protein
LMHRPCAAKKCASALGQVRDIPFSAEYHLLFRTKRHGRKRPSKVSVVDVWRKPMACTTLAEAVLVLLAATCLATLGGRAECTESVHNVVRLRWEGRA